MVDEIFMLFVVLKKVKQSIDLAKKGIAVKKTFDFVKSSKKGLFDEKDDKMGCATVIFVGIILFFLYRAGLV